MHPNLNNHEKAVICEMLSLVEQSCTLDHVAEMSFENFICILQHCRKQKNLSDAKRLHAHICNYGLETHRTVGNYIVPMFAECGSLPDAQQAFNRLVYRNEHSWTSLILGYIQYGEPQHAFYLYRKMQEDNVRPSRFTFMALLKACARLKDVARGQDVHVEIAQRGLDKDLFVGSTLVDMYAKCGSLSEARKAFDRLPVRNVVSWNALIAGYAEHGPGQEAVECFEQMQLRGVSPSAITFVCVLKACGSMGAIGKGQEVHMEITQRRLDTDLFVGSTLVDMYAKCGLLSEARGVFEKLPVRNVVSWTALIAGYAEYGPGQEALNCFEQMQLEGVCPNAITFICILKACGSIGALDKGRQIHREITQRRIEREIFFGKTLDNLCANCGSHSDLHIEIGQKESDRDFFINNTLVDMYAKCGSLSEAQEVFDKLQARNVVSWNALIAGYAEHGPGQQALIFFKEMRLEGFSPDATTFVCILKACGSIGAIDKGREIHTEITKKGFDRNPFVGSTLVDMYAKCGSLLEAQEVLDNLSTQNVVSWTALIAGYVEHGSGQEAMKCFEEMQMKGISPSAATFVCILKACGSIKAVDKGREIHMEIKQRGFESDLFVSNTLVDMYAKCGSLSDAWEVFDKLPIRNAVSWNALIAGYAEHGPGQEALKCFELMQLDGVCPNVVTFVCILKACGSIAAIEKGREVHTEVRKRGFERDLFVGSTLVDMYAKCGSLSEAQEVFNKLLVRDVVAWTALIAGYAEHGAGQEALKCFGQMQLEGALPDAITFVCSLKACSSTGALDKGREIHGEILRKGFERDPSVGSTLVDMYAKYGSLAEARSVFDKLPVRNVVSWSAMINGYGMNHKGNMAVQCFEDMQEQGMKPDAITFTCLLTACSHASMVLKGKEYFKMMREEYGIIPTVDHYTCMVDLCARSGHLYEAATFFEAMPCPPSIETWMALLSACKSYGEAELGLRCFEQLVQMDPEYAASYVLMANIYVSAGRRDDAYRVEEMRKQAGAKKKPASALIEVNKKLHEFMVGKNENKEISAMLEFLSSCMEEREHVPNLGLVLRPISDDEKEAALCEHAEKLAVAFGLLNTPRGEKLHVTKNMRMCNNCHNANKTISTIEQREIVVRDSYCVHHFKDGSCSCRDVF